MAPARLWLMTYMSSTMGTVNRALEYDAWRRAQGHCHGVIVQGYADSIEDELHQASKQFREIAFAPGLAIDTFLGTRDDSKPDRGVETNWWRNSAGWENLARFIENDPSEFVFLDFEILLKAPVADLRAVRSGLKKLPQDGKSYWIYPAWGDDCGWYEEAADVLGEHAIGVSGIWCTRISYDYGGSKESLDRTKRMFDGRVAALCWALQGREHDWTAAEIWGLCRTTPADGVQDVIALMNMADKQVDQWALCDALQMALDESRSNADAATTTMNYTQETVGNVSEALYEITAAPNVAPPNEGA